MRAPDEPFPRHPRFVHMDDCGLRPSAKARLYSETHKDASRFSVQGNPEVNGATTE